MDPERKAAINLIRAQKARAKRAEKKAAMMAAAAAGILGGPDSMAGMPGVPMAGVVEGEAGEFDPTMLLSGLSVPYAFSGGSFGNVPSFAAPSTADTSFSPGASAAAMDTSMTDTASAAAAAVAAGARGGHARGEKKSKKKDAMMMSGIRQGTVLPLPVSGGRSFTVPCNLPSITPEQVNVSD